MTEAGQATVASLFLEDLQSVSAFNLVIIGTVSGTQSVAIKCEAKRV